jgi:hypothetical protein
MFINHHAPTWAENPEAAQQFLDSSVRRLIGGNVRRRLLSANNEKLSREPPKRPRSRQTNIDMSCFAKDAAVEVFVFVLALSYIPFIFPLQEKKLADAKPIDTTETDTEPENDESEAKQAKKKRRAEDGDKIKKKKNTTHKKHRKSTTSKEQKLKKHKKSKKNKTSKTRHCHPFLIRWGIRYVLQGLLVIHFNFISRACDLSVVGV